MKNLKLELEKVYKDYCDGSLIGVKGEDEFVDVLYKLGPVYEYRPDLLAFDLYGDARLWWVFSQRNPNTLKDPYFDFVTGLEIYIPKLEYLREILGF
jgi:hypothetical protein